MQLLLLFVPAVLLASFVEASESTRAEYMELIRRHPHLVETLGDADQGEIEIILDKEKMAAIEKGRSRDVGVIARDNYWVWVNDACLFPGGRPGIYARLLWVRSLDAPSFVAIMPVRSDGKIVLVCNFRHATRSWEIELPRGAMNAGEEIDHGAKREALEKTGMVIDQLTPLGKTPTDSGVVGNIIPIYYGAVVKEKIAHPEASRAIEAVIALSVEEIKEAFARGYITLSIRGEENKVFFRDPFLAYALLLYELKSFNNTSQE